MNTEMNYRWWLIAIGVILVISLIIYSNFFLHKNSPELKVVFLGDKQDHVQTLAGWTYNKWKNYDPTLTLEKSIESYQKRLNTDKVPFVLLLLNKDQPIGMVYLNEHEPMPGFEDKSPWIGDFYMLPNYDRQGLQFRRYLMRNLEGVSKNLGFKKLYVFTSDPSRVDWYMELGWKIIKTDMHHDHLVTIMEYDIKD